ncbi:MAG: TetR/AcrR family transcriptional regulator [Candidatus Syntrophosphaera sp.]|nr:TetR/AcrR family transcriptional regulator [Candidatus Syntrophosphaera sp.]
MELTKRQEDIIQAAILIIARQGFKNLTTKNLAREMKLTEAALYRHFESKNDLITKILEYFQLMSCQVLEDIRTAGLAPLERVRRFVMNRYEMFSANPDLAQVMFSEELFRYDPAFSEQMRGIMHSHKDSVVSYLREAQEQGQIGANLDPGQLFRIIVGSMRFTVTQWNLSGQGFDLVGEGGKLFETIKQLIEVKK